IRDKANLDDVVNTPLASCLITGYIGAYLEDKGFEVTIISYPNMGFPEGIDTIPDTSIFRFFDIVGIHLVYQWDNTGKVLEMARYIKETNARTHVTVYGYYPTFTYESLLKENPFIDSVIVGEPEEPFAALAQLLEKGDKSRRNVGAVPFPGVAYRSASGIEFRPSTPLEDINAIPFPLRDNAGAGGEVFYILGSRGCFGRCSFCYIPEYHGKTSGWRGRNPENIIAEMKYIKKEFNASYFYFADASFFGPGLEGKNRANEFVELLKTERMKVRFGFECMPSNVEEGIFKKLVSIGLKDVFLGIESGSERILRLFRRKANKEENRNAIRIVQKLNINLSIGFIMFMPSSFVTDIRENFELLKEMELLSSPSNSAHLLSHREFLFKGMADGGMNFGSVGEGNRLFYNYEKTYKFEDDGVQMIYDAVFPACKMVLGLFKGEDLACANGGLMKMDVTNKINYQLREYFEDVLRSVEKGNLDKEGLKQRYKIFEQAVMGIKGC
ncbi:MAG: B12-binding domain-containing radical SAM protein, partial [Candidatus Omnitrophica bacterium]|nr:B12-binding domain-containing radical SAM protein [Candidatus Omnitrophota bacterium]